MLAKIPTLAAVFAAGALVLPAGAAAQGGGVLLSGYAPSGVSEETALGVPSAPRQSANAAATVITADALVAKQRPTDPVLTTTARGRPSRGTGKAPAGGRHARTASAPRDGRAAHAQAAVVEAAARGAGPASGLGGIWIFGGAVLVLAGAFAALWRGRTGW